MKTLSPFIVVALLCTSFLSTTPDNIKVDAINPYERNQGFGDYTSIKDVINDTRLHKYFPDREDKYHSKIYRIRNKVIIKKIMSRINNLSLCSKSADYKNPRLRIVLEYRVKGVKKRIAMTAMNNQNIVDEAQNTYKCDSVLYQTVLETLPKKFMKSDNLFKNPIKVKQCGCY